MADDKKMEKNTKGQTVSARGDLVTPTVTSRRDFITLTTVSMGVLGAAAALWPFLDSLNPSGDTLAVSTTEVDVSSLETGQAMTVLWRKSPVFIRRRTAEEISQARAVSIEELKDPDTLPQDQDRTLDETGEWLVLVGVCTHLGCTPSGQKVTDNRGDYGGWYCPCHGSHYDTSGRIRRGPAPTNLPVPPSSFVGEDQKKIRIG